MKSARILIIFTFLLAFALQVSAQNDKPKIVWKNLQEKYERFQDVAPIVFNDDNSRIFMPNSLSSAIEYGFIKLLKFDDEKNQWMPNYIWICGTITKKERKYISQNLSAYKIESKAERQIKFDGVDWFNLTKSSEGGIGFTELPSYNGAGKYKIQIPFSEDSKTFFVLESPAFEVIEKDFKK